MSASFLVRSLAVTFSDGHLIEPHSHSWGQLVYAASGVMRVSAEGMIWIIPPARAVWAPAGAEHTILARGTLALRTLYLAPELARALPAQPRAIEVSPLLRELVLRIVAIQMLRGGIGYHEALGRVVAEELQAAETLPLSLPIPRDPRARRAADRLRADPGAELDAKALARESGASLRTLQRLFLDETGLRLTEWRQRLRLLNAAALLGAGSSVTEAGLEAGYASTSAFIAAFRRQFGQTPARMNGGQRQ